MENVLVAMKALGKATCLEISARLGIELRETIGILNEQKDLGTVTCVNGYWQVRKGAAQ